MSRYASEFNPQPTSQQWIRNEQYNTCVSFADFGVIREFLLFALVTSAHRSQVVLISQSIKS